MYMRMITYHVKPDVDQEEAARIYDDLIDVLREQDGFQGSTLVVNDRVTTAISLTYWDDEVCAGAAGERVLPILFERSAELSEGPPEINGYHVLDHNPAYDGAPEV